MWAWINQTKTLEYLNELVEYFKTLDIFHFTWSSVNFKRTFIKVKNLTRPNYNLSSTLLLATDSFLLRPLRSLQITFSTQQN